MAGQTNIHDEQQQQRSGQTTVLLSRIYVANEFTSQPLSYEHQLVIRTDWLTDNGRLWHLQGDVDYSKEAYFEAIYLFFFLFLFFRRDLCSCCCDFDEVKVLLTKATAFSKRQMETEGQGEICQHISQLQNTHSMRRAAEFLVVKASIIIIIIIVRGRMNKMERAE